MTGVDKMLEDNKELLEFTYATDSKQLLKYLRTLQKEMKKNAYDFFYSPDVKQKLIIKKFEELLPIALYQFVKRNNRLLNKIRRTYGLDGLIKFIKRTETWKNDMTDMYGTPQTLIDVCSTLGITGSDYLNHEYTEETIFGTELLNPEKYAMLISFLKSFPLEQKEFEEYYGLSESSKKIAEDVLLYFDKNFEIKDLNLSKYDISRLTILQKVADLKITKNRKKESYNIFKSNFNVIGYTIKIEELFDNPDLPDVCRKILKEKNFIKLVFEQDGSVFSEQSMYKVEQLLEFLEELQSLNSKKDYQLVKRDSLVSKTQYCILPLNKFIEIFKKVYIDKERCLI